MSIVYRLNDAYLDLNVICYNVIQYSRVHIYIQHWFKAIKQ